jgi:hypothetical protein
MRSRLANVIAVVGVAACGYVESGRWEDAPDNWTRAFAVAKPANVQVLHSYYWRAPHFSYEAGYFFAIRDAGGFRAELFSTNKLRRVSGRAAEQARASLFGTIPPWFAPKPVGRYDVWMLESSSSGNLRVFVDRDDGTLFFADYQV